MAKSILFNVGDDVLYLFGEPDSVHYRVIATKNEPHIRKGGPNDGQPLYVEEGKDYIVIRFPLLPDRISPYVHVFEHELDQAT